MSSLRVICIVGNIGVGKSTTVDALKALDRNMIVVHEPVDQWRKTGLLSALYDSLLPTASVEKRQHTAYDFQQFAFASRLSSVRRAVGSPPTVADATVAIDGHVLVDRHVFAKQLFEMGAITSDMWTWYNENFSDWEILVPEARPKAIIYLRAQPETCLARIRERGRSEEAGISLDYLQALHNKFDRLLNTRELVNCPVVTIDCDNSTYDQVAAQVLHTIRLHNTASPTQIINADAVDDDKAQ
jgi:deoxycitidine kinase